MQYLSTFIESKSYLVQTRQTFFSCLGLRELAKPINYVIQGDSKGLIAKQLFFVEVERCYTNMALEEYVFS